MNLQLRGRQSLIRKAVALIWLLLFTVYCFTAPQNAQDDPATKKRFKSLRQLMEEGIHERFTFISYTLWHNSPMSPEKMDAIAESANHLRYLAQRLPSYAPSHLQAEWAKDDRLTFEAKAERLAEVAAMLAEAANKRDKEEAEKQFEVLEATCRSCHAKFRKDLASE